MNDHGRYDSPQILDAFSEAGLAVGRWKARCADGHHPAIGALVSRTAYGQTPREAAARFRDSLKAQSKEE